MLHNRQYHHKLATSINALQLAYLMLTKESKPQALPLLDQLTHLSLQANKPTSSNSNETEEDDILYPV